MEQCGIDRISVEQGGTALKIVEKRGKVWKSLKLCGIERKGVEQRLSVELHIAVMNNVEQCRTVYTCVKTM
jgi:hypothetical protein